MVPFIFDEEESAEGAEFWVDAAISAGLVIFAGLMSGLNLGLMALDAVDLEVLKRSGTDTEKQQASVIAPVVQKQNQLLVTLLLCNAGAMEALPIFLDKMFNPVVAVILSVTFVLAFGEVIPQAICTRYGLAVGFYLIWLVKVLMFICTPISYPVGKVLDVVLGENDSALFRRAQLKALVSIHGKEEGQGGELTHDETTIISGALDLTEKTAEEAMTPIESTFSVDVNSKLDWEAMGKILARGHSRIPVYDGNERNVIGLLLVKSLLTVRAEDAIPVSSVSIRRIPKVPADLPLYDMLNDFQKGGSHMAAVVKTKNYRKPKRSLLANALFPSEDKKSLTKVERRSLQRQRSDAQTDVEKGQVEGTLGVQNDTGLWKADRNDSIPKAEQPEKSEEPMEAAEEGEVIGIITLEDVIEELLQEEIVDETDEYVDVHNRIRVAAVAASMTRGASLVQRASKRFGSFRERNKDSNRVRFAGTEKVTSDRAGDAPTSDPSTRPSLDAPKSESLRRPLLESEVDKQ